MYTLRRISGDGTQMNRVIGDGYTLVEQSNEAEFKRTMESLNISDEDVYAFVTTGTMCQPLYKKQQAFIMTENGKTFSNLTHVDLKHEIKWPKKPGQKKTDEVALLGVRFMLEQISGYSDSHLFPVSDIKRLIALSHIGNAEWLPSEELIEREAGEEKESEEDRTHRNSEIIGGFMEHCEREGLVIPDKYFESYFNA